MRRIAVRGIVLNKDKLLCVRLTDYREGINPDYWCVPGGKLEEGEPILKGLEREFIEELGIKPTIGKLLFIQQYAHPKFEQLELFFHVTNTNDFLAIDITKSSHGKIEIAEVGFIVPSENKVLPEFLKDKSIDINQSAPKIYSYL